jgi:putative DNA primase/helicase
MSNLVHIFNAEGFSAPAKAIHPRGTPSHRERALEALASIPADLTHDEWVKAGMGAHAAGLSLDDYDRWSAMGDNYDAAACKAAWKSFKPGTVTEATLYYMAAEHGWKDPHKGLPASQRPAPAPKPPVPPPKPSTAPLPVWNRFEPATSEHPYIQAKGATAVPLDGFRVVPAGDPLHIMGETMAGALVVPVVRTDMTIASLQFITVGETAQSLKAKGKPTKLNLPGASIEGWFTVGDLLPGGVAYLCEGIGTAWAAWMATGRAAVVCFGAGNMGKVAQALRLQDRAARLVICPDVGKEGQAQSIAAAAGGAVAAMPEGWPANSDLHDLGEREGLDVVAAMLDSAQAPPTPEPLLKPVSVFDVLTHPAPPPEFVWADYIPCGVVTLMGAHGGTGKSTIALMLAVCAAVGRPLFGAEVKPCKVLFASLEDSGAIVRHRLAHICKLWGIDPLALGDCLRIVDGTEYPELFSAEGRGAGELTDTYKELSTAIETEGIGLVIVDNASDAFAGEEIQRRQVRAFIRALAMAVKPTNAGCLLLAHVDKSTSKARKAEGGEGYSGSTAWHNSARSRLFLTRGDDGLLTVEHQKSNLGRMREPITLEWAKDGLPQLVEQGTGFEMDSLNQRQQGRADDARAAALLKLIAEFEGRGQYCHTGQTSRSNPYAVLKSEPSFQRLKLNSDATKRIVNQCQRAKWLEPLDYRTPDRKPHQRWTLTHEGRLFAGLSAPTAPTAPTTEDGTHGARGAPTAPTALGGMGE